MGTTKRVQQRTVSALAKAKHRLFSAPPHSHTARTSHDIARFIARYCVSASAVDIRHVDYIQLQPIIDIMRHCPNLTYFATSYLPQDVEPMPEISEWLPHLTCLCLDTQVSAVVVHEIARRLPQLRALQLGQFSTDSDFAARDVARLLDRCAHIEVLTFLSKRCFVEQVCRHTARVAHLKSLGAPYSFVNNDSVRALHAVGALINKIELNFGCDYLTLAGLRLVFKHCDNLVALSFTSATPIDFTCAMAVLCDRAVLPKLRRLGVRARERADPRTLVDFHRLRPEVELYNYRVKRYCGRWCFKAFDFYEACCRAGVIRHVQ